MRIDLPAAASTTLVNVKRVSFDCGSRWRRQTDLVLRWLAMIGELQVGAIDAVKLPNHSQEIGLSAKQVPHNDSRALSQPLPAKMFQIGRASCRERVWIWGVAVTGQRTEER